MGSRQIRKALRQVTAFDRLYVTSGHSPLITLTRGDGTVQVKRGSKGEELLRRSGWKEGAP